MKFIHIADVHFDIPFTRLEGRNLSEMRRLEQRNAFRKVIEYVKENAIPYLFICGDLYEQEYVKKSTIEYINKLFETIPNTKIYIVPGNHDPYINNSYYAKFNWAKNVKIFKEKPEKIEENNICIYGYGFEDFYMKKSEDIEIEDKDKINILLTHGTLDGDKKGETLYNPISKTKLTNLGFDYIALGHIHKISYNEEENQKIVYPGSLISLGFDELGSHGMILGEIEESTKKLKLEFIEIDEKEFIEKEIDISDISSQEELIEKINAEEYEENGYFKITLVGNRKIEVNPNEILKNINYNNIIKIKDKTKLEVDLLSMAKQNNLKGFFVKDLLERAEKEPENKEKIYKAIEIGLLAFENK